MNNFGFLDTPYTPGGASLVLEKIWSKIKQCGISMDIEIQKEFSDKTLPGMNVSTHLNLCNDQ